MVAGQNTDSVWVKKLWDVKGVTFEGCRFIDSMSVHAVGSRGVYAADAVVLLDTRCDAPYLGDCECPENYATYSSFTGFTTAVEVNTTGNPYPVKVNQVQFSNNETGVKINGNNFATVTRCDFDLQSASSSLTNTGLVLDNCTGYKVEGNRFHKARKFATPTSTGIRVNNSGTAVNNIYRNLFDTLDYGIQVLQKNSGLQLSCDTFTFGDYDIYITFGGSIASSQGSVQQGADNKFVNTQVSSLYNAALSTLSYYHSRSNNHIPRNPYNVNIYGATACNCPSTLCNGGIPDSDPVTSFASQVSSYTAATGNANADTVETQNFASLQTMRQSLSETYYDAVRTIMSDTVLDLNELEQWHTAAQPIADPYSLTETRFMEGYAEIFAENAEDAETANYADFHALKLALRGVNDGIVGANNHSPLQRPQSIIKSQKQCKIITESCPLM